MLRYAGFDSARAWPGFGRSWSRLPAISAGPRNDGGLFYDALAENESAVEVMGNDSLKIIAHELLTSLKSNVTVDWIQRESAPPRCAPSSYAARASTAIRPISRTAPCRPCCSRRKRCRCDGQRDDLLSLLVFEHNRGSLYFLTKKPQILVGRMAHGPLRRTDSACAT